MSREKQIDDMANVIKSSLDGLGSGNFNFTGNEISTMFAKALYAAGYRKQEWISVNERLPGVSGRYICAVKDKNGHTWTVAGDYNLEMKKVVWSDVRRDQEHRHPLDAATRTAERRMRWHDAKIVCTRRFACTSQTFNPIHTRIWA